MSARDKYGPDAEDAALWAYVTRNVKRSEPRRLTNRPMTPEAEAEHKPRRSPPVHSNGKAAAPQRPLPPAPTVTVKTLPEPPRIEARKLKRVVRGRDGIEARIDLHGMRQVEAHGALRAFLHRAFHNGFRLVLVITGKGREVEDDRHLPFDMFSDRDRGVLRRNVPRWLTEPDLRAIVVGYTSAHLKHGGDGAFYVQLRNSEKHRG